MCLLGVLRFASLVDRERERENVEWRSHGEGRRMREGLNSAEGEGAGEGSEGLQGWVFAGIGCLLLLHDVVVLSLCTNLKKAQESKVK